jgi:hypothetical protein
MMRKYVHVSDILMVLLERARYISKLISEELDVHACLIGVFAYIKKHNQSNVTKLGSYLLL